MSCFALTIVEEVLYDTMSLSLNGVLAWDYLNAISSPPLVFPAPKHSAVLFAALEELKRQAARHRGREALAEVQNALVEQSVLHELDQVTELLPGKPDRLAEQRIDAGLDDPLDRAFKEVAGTLLTRGL